MTEHKKIAVCAFIAALFIYYLILVGVTAAVCVFANITPKWWVFLVELLVIAIIGCDMTTWANPNCDPEDIS